MARPRAIKDEKVFAIADQLAKKGIDPSIVRVAEIAKRRYGATPSYTTLKSVLSQWSTRPSDSKNVYSNAQTGFPETGDPSEFRELSKELARSLHQVREELVHLGRNFAERIDALEARIAKLGNDKST